MRCKAKFRESLNILQLWFLHSEQLNTLDGTAGMSIFGPQWGELGTSGDSCF
jgi:hypothetical protein